MNGLLEMLLGLRTLRLGERGVEFGFRFPLAAWEWAAVAILCGLAGWWSYRRLDAPRPGRVALAVVRALLLVLLVFLATGPRLQRPNDTLERDWVLMLVDRSASMRVADGPKGPDGARQTREAELKAALARHRPAFDEIAKGRVVLWSGFDGGLVDLKPATSATGAPVELMAPDGARSDLGLALERMTARAAARPLSGVVVFSDGRSTDTPSRAVQRRLATLRVPIITVPLGSAEALGDAAVRSVDAPGVAFVGDAVPIQATIERNGAAARGRARVELVNTVTGEVLDRRDIDAVSDAEADGVHQDRVTLTTTPGVAGETQWAVRVVPEGDDLAQENNSVPLRIALTDRPLRVLYLDGYPRWEYRYLQAALSRERSMASTAWLLSGGRRFIQEGNTPIDALPTTTEEWDKIDVIMLGDLRPEVLSPEQLRQIRQRVAVGGAGLMWIAGEASTPGAWRGTPLADLLPVVTSGDSDSGQRVWDRDVVMKPTALAERLGVLRLNSAPAGGANGVAVGSEWWPAAVSDPASGWSHLRWALRLDASLLKPAAEVLATAVPVDDPNSAGEALVVTMRYGAGRSLLVATDEIWRWRYGRGEDLPQRFWLQLIRMLGRDSVARSGRPAVLTATPARAETSQPVRVQLELIDQGVIDAAGASLTVRVTRIETGEASDVVLRPLAEASSRAAGERPKYAGVWVPPERGLYRMEPVETFVRGNGEALVRAEVDVRRRDDELRRPESNHALLAGLSKQTAEAGGVVLAVDQLDQLPGKLPRREVRVALAPDEQTLWDSPLALTLLLMLLTAEWVGRRLIRLV